MLSLSMLAIYDFDCSPVSYDFMSFLVHAQYKAKGKPVHVLFIPGKNAGWRIGEHKPISVAEKEWRLTHIQIGRAHV